MKISSGSQLKRFLEVMIVDLDWSAFYDLYRQDGEAKTIVATHYLSLVNANILWNMYANWP